MRFKFSYQRNLFLFSCSVIVSFILYANTLGHNFILDDFDLIVNNSYIKNLIFLPRLFFVNAYHFSSSPLSNYYRPLQLVSYALDYHFWKLNPAYYHLINILLHAVNSFLASLLILKLFSSFRLALIAGLLFCLHPMAVSVVGYISGRADLLVTLFMLLSLLKFYDYLKEEKLGAFIQSFVFFGLALLCRENALLLPFFAMLLASACERKRQKIFLPLFGFFILLIFYVYGRVLLFNKAAFLGLPLKSFSSPLELVNLANILRHYIELFIFPWPLYPMRTVPFIENLTLGNVLTTFCFFGLFGLFFVWAFLKKERMIAFGMLWFLIGFLPLIRMMYLFPRFGAVAAENWMYFPSLGVFIVLARFLFKKNKGKSALCVCIFCYFAVFTVLNNRPWKDNLTIYQHTLKFSPNNTNIRLNLADVYFKNGSNNLALRELNTILKTEGKAWDVYLDLGNVYLVKGELERALFFYDKAIQFNPRCSQAYYNKGLIMAQRADDEQARLFFLKALEINPDYCPPYSALGDLFFRRGLYGDALKMYERSALLKPEEKIQLKIGVTLVQLASYQKAAIIFKQILRNNSDSVETMKTLGLCYGRMGALDEAIHVWTQVLEKNPADDEVKNYIAKAKMLQNLKNRSR